MSDFFIAGSWRNRDAVLQVVEALERSGASTYSFVRAQYDDDASAFADRSETLYRIFDTMTADASGLVRHLDAAER